MPDACCNLLDDEAVSLEDGVGESMRPPSKGRVSGFVGFRGLGVWGFTRLGSRGRGFRVLRCGLKCWDVG